MTVLVGESSNFIVVKFSNTKSGTDKIFIMNLIGRSMVEHQYSGEESMIINEVSSLSNGLYIVIAKDANGKILDSSKFMLTK